jgi:hypothetical protein
MSAESRKREAEEEVEKGLPFALKKRTERFYADNYLLIQFTSTPIIAKWEFS